MSVSFSTSGTLTSTATAVTTLSGTVNLGSLTNGAIVVCIQLTGGTNPTLTTSTFGSTTLTAVTSAASTANAASGTCQWFAATGVTGSATLTFTWSTPSATALIHWKSFSGVDQTGGSTSFLNGTSFNGNGSQTSAPSNQAVTTANGDATVYAWITGQTFTGTQTPAVDTSQNTGGTGAVIGESQHILSTSTSDAYNCLLSSADQINGAGFHLKAAAGSSGPPAGVQNNDLAAQGLTWPIKFSDGYGSRYRSWEKWAQQTPTVKTTFGGNYPWPNPQPVVWYQSWLEPGNNFPPLQFFKPFNQQDWPNPPRTVWYQSWAESGNVQLPFPTPFQPLDWPNPQRTSWYKSTEESGLALTTPVGNPFFQSDWPNPYPVSWYRDWFNALVINMPSFMALPPLWDVGGITPDTTDRSWTFNFTILQQVSQGTPFFQTDWPNPLRTVWDSFWSQGIPFGAMQTPFHQTDWPLPYPVQWYEAWQQVLAPYLPTFQPFAQTDWQNPKTWSPIDQWWFNNLTSLLTAPPPTLPFRQTDWPVPKGSQPIDPTWLQALTALFPPPPPVPAIISAGRQITESELNQALADWSKKSYDYLQSQSLSAQFSRIGKLGGRPRK